MTKLNEFIGSIAKEAGYEGDENFQKVVAALPEDITLPEDFSDKFNSTYVTVGAAINGHDDIKNHYDKKFKGKYLGTVDVMLKNYLQETGVPEEFLEEYSNETETYKKLQAALKAHSSYMETKVSKGKGNGEKEKELTDKINQLNQKLADTDAQWAEKLKSQASQFEMQKVNHEKQKILSAYNFATSDALSLDDIHLIIDKKIETKGAEFRYDEQGNLTNYKKGTDEKYYENNKYLSPKELYDQIASAYTKKSGKQDGKGGENPPAYRQKEEQRQGAHHYGAAYNPI